MVFVIVQTILLALLLGTFLWNGGPVLVERGEWAVWCGRALAVAGIALALGAGVSLGASTRITPRPGDGAVLVERGVYRLLRHPMYTSAWLVSTALVLMHPRLFVALTGAAVIVFYMIKERYEEGLLLAHYPGYATYRARTRGMWLTKPR